MLGAAVLTGAAVSAFANMPGNADRACGGSTLDIVDCLSAQAATWDKRLNSAYRAARAASPQDQRDQLREAQRAWIKYRDANCLYYRMGEGSIAQLQAADCLLWMTRERTIELETGGAGPDNPGR